jgi:RND family efflux transporter MFP subunit
MQRASRHITGDYDADRIAPRRRRAWPLMKQNLRTLAPLLLLPIAAACHRADPPPPPSPAVLTTVVHATVEPTLRHRSSVAPGARLKLGFNAAGVIAEVRVKMGDVVHKGEVLARLRDSGGGAMLAAAEAQRHKALRDRERTEKLVAWGTMAPAQGEDALSSLRVASANANIAATALAQRVIVAPINGTVLERFAEPGESVGPGAPVIVLDDTQRVVVKVGVTERELSRVAASQRATLVEESTGMRTLGVVTSIAPAPREDGLYTLEVEPAALPSGQPRTLPPGSMVTVELDDLQKGTSMRVPLDALVERDGKTWAFVVAPAARAALTTVTMRALQIDRAEDKEVVVRVGLQEGDRIVREGAYFLSADDTVRLLD